MSYMDEFFNDSTIERNEASEAIFTYLSSPDTVTKMIDAADMRLPVLTPIVKELEEKYDNPLFPLNTKPDESNAKYRRNVGWMIRYIMRDHGYVPADGPSIMNHIPRSYVPENEKGKDGIYIWPKYFEYGAKYRKMLPEEQVQYLPRFKVVHKICVRKSGTLIEQ